MPIRVSFLAVVFASSLLLAMPSGAAEEGKIKVLLVTGANNHKWKETTAELKAIYEKSGKFDVEVSEDPDVPAFSDAKALGKFDVIVLNLNRAKRWGSDREENFLNYVKNGGGLVVYHASDNAFSGWDEYDRLVGGTWRSKGTSFPNKGTFHPKYGPFEVEVVDRDHPITHGLASFKTTDEKYSNLRLQDNIHVLAQAMQDGKPQPLLFVSNYDKGRMFQTALGHDVNAMKTPEFGETLVRGTVWAARK